MQSLADVMARVLEGMVMLREGLRDKGCDIRRRVEIVESHVRHGLWFAFDLG